MSQDQPLIKKIRSTKAMREVMGEYFVELDAAAKTSDAKVAWCTSVGPAELLRSLGFLVYFPENHGALLGTSRMAADLIPAANAAGYSPDICSYLTSDVGAYLSGVTPLTRAFGMESVPRPDVLVYNTNQCRDVQDWFAFYQREFDVPLLGIETPRAVSQVTQEMVDGLVAQEKALIPTLEQVSGNRFDLDRLREVVASSYRCTLLWKKVLRIAEHRPSPITFFDGTIHMGPAVVLRGDERAERYYETLIAEGLAHDDPFEGMARAYTELFIVRSEEFKEQYLEGMAADYAINGVIYHNAKTCPNNSNCSYGLQVRLTDRLGLPHVVIDGDLNDLRLYSEEQARTQFEALVEQLQAQPA